MDDEVILRCPRVANLLLAREKVRVGDGYSAQGRFKQDVGRLVSGVFEPHWINIQEGNCNYCFSNILARCGSSGI